MLKNNRFFLKAGPLLLVLFIDGMGLSLIMPILNALLFDPGSHFFASQQFSPRIHSIIYGGVISIFMLCWFFGAALLGELSDYIGRKKSLVICLSGAMLSYLISAVAVITHSLLLLIIGRIIGGFTSGSQPIAQAAIIDLSEPEHKVRNIGYILLSLSLGFIAGPLLGGFLADNNLVSWFNFSTPFYFAAAISLINVFLLLWLFDESFINSKGKFSLKLYTPIAIFISAFKHPQVKRLSVLFFIFIFGWSSFYSFIALYLINIYQFTPSNVSVFMAVMGLGFGFGNGVMVQLLTKRFPLRPTFLWTTFLSALMSLLMVVIPHQIMVWILMAPMACCVAVAYSVIISLFSDQVDAQSQGWVMGITGSIMALVWALNAVIVGLVASWSAQLPIYIAGIFLLVTCVLQPLLKNKPITEHKPEAATAK